MSRTLALVIAPALGAAVAVQIPLNSNLGRHTGILGAAFISTAITATVLGVVIAAGGDPRALAAARHVPLIYAVGGGLIGVLLLSMTIVVLRELGAAAMTAGFVCAQLLASALIDRFGMFGVTRGEISLSQLAGFALLIAGTLLVTSR